jgi:hypothetical protein
MKIMICGSMTFANEMVDAKKRLEELGHSAELPCDTDVHVGDSDFIDDLDKDYKHCVENKVMEKCFDMIAESDAILVLNHPKNSISGYVGTSTLMEIGLAKYLGKKIFILNALPDYKQHRWVHEVRIMQPVMLNGDLSKVV